MKRIVWLSTLLFLLLPSSIRATDCSGVDRERLQKLANNITVTMEETPNEFGKIYFKATFAGFSDELIIRSSDLAFSSLNIGDDAISYAVAHNLLQNKNYRYSVEGFYKCYGVTFRNITINTPKYNLYYDDELCKENREFYLCNKWGDFNKTYEEFEKEIKEYKKKVTIETIIDSEDSMYAKFYSLYEKYYFPVLISTIIILGLLVFLWVKENKKFRL